MEIAHPYDVVPDTPGEGADPHSRWVEVDPGDAQFLGAMGTMGCFGCLGCLGTATGTLGTAGTIGTFNPWYKPPSDGDDWEADDD